MRKIGAFAGKFLPPHLGHAYAINEAAKQCDELFVVLSENPEKCKKLCKDNGLPNLTAKQRLSWLKTHFKNQPNIKFLYMDETGLEPFPNGLKEWTERFYEVVPKDVNMKFADETYRELNEKYFPNCKFVAFSRNIVPISATMIRSDPEKYFDFLLPSSKAFFEEKLLNKRIK